MDNPLAFSLPVSVIRLVQTIPLAANRSLALCTMSHPTNLSVSLQTAPEILRPISLSVSGKFPEYLGESTLYRVGPGIYDAKHSDGEPYKITHWFDGLSVLHAFHIDAQKNSVAYRSRSLSDNILRAVEATPSQKWTSITFNRTDPCRSLLGRFFQLWTASPIDLKTSQPHMLNIGVTLQPVAGKNVVVRSDVSEGLVLDEDTLEIDHFFNYEGLDQSLNGLISAAHGHVDPVTGEFFNYVYNLNGIGPTPYSVFKVYPNGTTQTLATIRKQPAFLHSFATTENYVILIHWPLHINGLGVLWHRNFMDAYSFRKDVDTEFTIISRHGKGVIAKYKTSAFFCFHTINAFERDDAIHIDLCYYDDTTILDDFKLPDLASATAISPATFARFTLPNISAASSRGSDEPKHASIRRFTDGTIELPRIHPKFKQQDYRFVYGISNENQVFDAIVKLDVTNGKRVIWTDANAIAAEPIFVPNPDGKEEDDGCVLVTVLDANAKKSSLIVLDAKSMKEVANAQVPQIIPFHFHGMVRPKGIDFSGKPSSFAV